MEVQRSLFVLLSILSAVMSFITLGLSCVNDFVNNVSCSWHSPSLAPGVNCSISGVKKTWILKNHVRDRTCRLEQYRNSPPGCSFVFENKAFNPFKAMPKISMECDGEVVENISNYQPHLHIKMHPPGVPEVTATANDTWISWSAGSPISAFIKFFDFQVQIKQESQAWTEAHNLSTQELQVRIPSWDLMGPHHVRVSVYPTTFSNSQWSNWSPTTSWYNVRAQVYVCVFTSSMSNLLALFGSCRLHNEKPVPNPSKYFHTLHSIHKGNLKAWLNPLSASETFFTAQPVDHISPVELCESKSSLLHFKSYLSGDLDTSRDHDNFSSSSSSFFSNLGYFLSSSTSSSAQTEPIPAYFICGNDFHNRLHSPTLPLSLCPPSMTSNIYESLKREPQSPDSGFGKDPAEEKEEAVLAEGEEVSDDHQTCPFLLGPFLPPSQLSAPVSGSYAAWPSASAMCRSSSMPVEPCKTGYLTLKELQATFSNKSI
uniref:Fibronectin type-III domain-containing protein n=1 Tax=Mola mola TaxID=94237 RepID=A0A3Q3VTX6_MOLML